MAKLIKYEFRKTLFSKLVLLAVTGIAEAAFLAGVFLKREGGIALGIFLLTFCAVAGIFYIGIESLLVLNRDLNTRQGYLLFLVPRNSYQILGAKIVENGVSIFAAGLCFGALALADSSIAVLYIGGLEEFLEIVRYVAHSFRFEIDIPVQNLWLALIGLLVSWLMMLVAADLAIILSATVLSGKRFTVLLSFVLYLLVVAGGTKLLSLLPDLGGTYANYGLNVACSFLLILVMYGLACWIMEKKLSV